MTTATLERKCIACGHDNAPGGDSCSSCGSSLDLKLCAACEAINGASADRCHACGDVFTSATGEAVLDGKVLAVLREPYVTKSFARRGKRFAMFFGVLAGMLSLPAYLLVSTIASRVGPAAEKQPQQAAVQEQVNSARPTSAKARVDAPKATEPTGGIVATAQAAAPRPTAPTAGVTHTRRADAPASKSVPQEKAAPVSPPKAASAAAEKTATAAVAAQPVIHDSAPTALGHVRVTHTKAMAADAAVVPVAGVAGNMNSVSERSASAGNGRAPGCDERVAALGLCKSN